MRDGEDGEARFAFGSVKELAGIEGFAFLPLSEARRGEDVVESEDEFEAFLGGVEGFEIEDADLGEGRMLDALDEQAEIEVGPLPPGIGEQGGEQDGFTAFDGIGVELEETEEAGDGGLDAVGDGLGVVSIRGGEGREDVDGTARGTAGGVDGHVDLLAQSADTVGRLAPGSEAFFPELGLLGGEVVGGDAFALGVLFVDPGAEVRGLEIREREEEIGEVAFGIDDDGGNAVDGGLFQQGEAEAGLAAAGHADADGVGDKVAGIVKERDVLSGFGGGVVGATEVEGP